MGRLVVYTTAAGSFIYHSNMAWSRYLEPRLKWRENYHNIDDERNRSLVEQRLSDPLFRFGWAALAVAGVIGSAITVTVTGAILNWRPVSSLVSKLRYGLIGAIMGFDVVNLMYFLASVTKFVRYGMLSRPDKDDHEYQRYDYEGELVKPIPHYLYRYVFFAPSVDSDRRMLSILYMLAGLGIGVAYTFIPE